MVRTSNENRLVVILSHHPLFTLSNHRAPDNVQAEDLRRMLHRFQNVVLWLNGHIHMNLVQPHANRSGAAVGFWEVTTSSLVDWLCQGRVVEIFDAGSGRLAIACTTTTTAATRAWPDGPELAACTAAAANDPPRAWLARARPPTGTSLLTLPARFRFELVVCLQRDQAVWYAWCGTSPEPPAFAWTRPRGPR
jgi:hypothetical protein